jgi:hypothetical protein
VKRSGVMRIRMTPPDAMASCERLAAAAKNACWYSVQTNPVGKGGSEFRLQAGQTVLRGGRLLLPDRGIAEAGWTVFTRVNAELRTGNTPPRHSPN